ncbi:hypothetical protein PARC_a1774 [Pseudoalteromonas arctica A 37-1-2]|uniref:Uncharacterized protein n=1 Tax=Pseudoalteromonas arctica A 37-1-2 TaxID=1117313 RepID=A0A290S551_9GAMM|nr:hypothetical protein PARC_a1774 [Pseudoalteromonas arctica A 37-1-2]
MFNMLINALDSKKNKADVNKIRDYFFYQIEKLCSIVY